MKDYTCLGKIVTGKNCLRPEVEKGITNESRVLGSFSFAKKSNITSSRKIQICKTLVRPRQHVEQNLGR
jgi:hypothetical protein